jgi:hypothetical protein
MICPKCGHPGQARHIETRTHDVARWYICKCRHAFKTLAPIDGPEVVVAQTPADRIHTSSVGKLVPASFPCPNDGGDGRIKWTSREHDGYYRRHVCRTCSLSYYSCTTEDAVTILRRMPGRRAAAL